MEPGEVVRPGQGHVNDQTLPFSTGVLLGQLGPTMDLLRNVSVYTEGAGSSTWEEKD